MQLDIWGCKYHELVLGKPSADYYIDEKARKSDDSSRPRAGETSNRNCVDEKWIVNCEQYWKTCILLKERSVMVPLSFKKMKFFMFMVRLKLSMVGQIIKS